MDSQEHDRLNLWVQLAKSLLLLVLSLAGVVAVCWYLYAGLWQPLTGLGVPLFILAMTVVMGVAYLVGWMPAAKAFVGMLRGQPTKREG